ncbi:MAG: 2-C-methyl-D-erythritol 2,4-cyclodiphosphate synthase [Lachnospiraceae bacterium]|nr:2-C-methyl-D-erythritol 2,4-cyclodiphosphate synthase [Lachnospiraceae bacterium]
MRIGQGYDVHRLVEGRDLILGGVRIPYEKGLLGHSDADVLLHAIMDSILGAAALKDIGYHFPDTDPKFKGISSIELLKMTSQIIHEAGFKVVNIDSTLIMQEPKVRPFVDEMRSNIAKSLSLDIGRVSVKATTEEGLGFTGRKEGIGAIAISLIDSL